MTTSVWLPSEGASPWTKSTEGLAAVPDPGGVGEYPHPHGADVPGDGSIVPMYLVSVDQGRLAMLLEFPGQPEEAWSDEEKARWLALHGGTPTHVVSCRPRITIEVVVPPWEHVQTRVARAAVGWSKHITELLREAGIPGVDVVGVHCEDSAHQTSPVAGIPVREEVPHSATA